MEKKGKTALILTALAAIASGGIAFNFVVDQSITTISGDTINSVMNQFNIDMNVEDFREKCAAAYDTLDENIKSACDLLSRIP